MSCNSDSWFEIWQNNVWCNKNQTKLISVLLLWLVRFLMHQTLAACTLPKCPKQVGSLDFLVVSSQFLHFVLPCSLLRPMYIHPTMPFMVSELFMLMPTKSWSENFTGPTLEGFLNHEWLKKNSRSLVRQLRPVSNCLTSRMCIGMYEKQNTAGPNWRHHHSY